MDPPEQATTPEVESTVPPPVPVTKKKKSRNRKEKSDENAENDKRGLVVPANYKTQLCRNWEAEKKCPYGKRCVFAHELCELRTIQINLVAMSHVSFLRTGKDAYGRPAGGDFDPTTTTSTFTANPEYPVAVDPCQWPAFYPQPAPGYPAWVPPSSNLADPFQAYNNAMRLQAQYYQAYYPELFTPYGAPYPYPPPPPPEPPAGPPPSSEAESKTPERHPNRDANTTTPLRRQPTAPVYFSYPTAQTDVDWASNPPLHTIELERSPPRSTPTAPRTPPTISAGTTGSSNENSPDGSPEVHELSLIKGRPGAYTPPMQNPQTPPRSAQRGGQRHTTPIRGGSGESKGRQSPLIIRHETPSPGRIPTCTEVEEGMGIVQRCMKMRVSEGTNTDPELFDEALPENGGHPQEVIDPSN